MYILINRATCRYPTTAGYIYIDLLAGLYNLRALGRNTSDDSTPN